MKHGQSAFLIIHINEFNVNNNDYAKYPLE